jgi:hypothetical protein
MMKKLLLLALLLIQINSFAQTPIIDSWIMNTTGAYASYWENTAAGGPPNYVYVPTTDSADVLQVCYSTDSVWVRSEGMTNDMGQYLNPGGCEPQAYVFVFPRTPNVPSSKTISPKTGAIGLLINGIPVYGLSNSYSWNGTTNTNMGGANIWNVEVYLSEGFVLDTAFAAHPQQDGAYHSHATPWRLFQSTPSTQHSPLVGYAFDGYPIYGPYGYSTAMNSSSAIIRMKTGYSLRNITVRQELPYGVTLTASQYGPAVSSTYPLGTYCEDYEWLASNGGDLDKYNGRFCVTPEYPGGTYAYFVTMDAAGTPEFPYYIGIEYYGDPVDADLAINPTITMPTSGTNCQSNDVSEISGKNEFSVYPNPASDVVNILWNNYFTYEGHSIVVTDGLGRTVYKGSLSENITLNDSFVSGMYYLHVVNSNNEIISVQKIVVNK